jgi:hypothetical protein
MALQQRWRMGGFSPEVGCWSQLLVLPYETYASQKLVRGTAS